MSTERTRNINIETLRILAMLMIIIGHSIGHTYLLQNMSSRNINYYLVLLLRIICNVATNIYVLMSGYFLCEKRFKLKRFTSLWFQVFFYSFGIYIFFMLMGWVPLTLGNLTKTLLPVSGNQYWFARVYLGLYLLTPFLNLFIKHINKKQYQALLVTSVVLFSLWRSFIPFAVTLNSEGGNSIIWFVVLYMFAAYIKIYGCPIRGSIRNLGIAGILVLFSFITNVGITYLSNYWGLGGKGASLFTEFTSFPMLFAAIFWLCAFLELPEKNGRESVRIFKFIMFFSTSTFSAYLIHENMYLKHVLWEGIDIVQCADSYWITPIILVVSISIFLASTFIDKLLFIPIKRLVDRIQFPKAQKVIDEYLYNTEK